MRTCVHARRSSAPIPAATRRPGDPPARACGAPRSRYATDASLEPTVHVTHLDRRSLRQCRRHDASIEDQFGSRLMTTGGFLLNNELTDFSFVPAEDGTPVANRVQGGKRPRSSMSPTIVYDRLGRVAIVRDRPAAARSSTMSPSHCSAIIDWDSIRRPRSHSPISAVAMDPPSSRPIPTSRTSRPSCARSAPRSRVALTSGPHTIVRTNGWVGGADPRREGVVRGQ